MEQKFDNIHHEIADLRETYPLVQQHPRIDE
ncbi:hypothetical protein ACNKHT_26850 [Shigella flexneri]